MNGVEPVACQGFLVGGTCVCVLRVQLHLFSLECNEDSRSEFWSVYDFGMALGRPSFNVQSYVPAG